MSRVWVQPRPFDTLSCPSVQVGEANLLRELKSVELDNLEVLCLLSLQDRVQLGLIKDLRRGRAKLSGHRGSLEVARHAKTELQVLNVCQFLLRTSN